MTVPWTRKRPGSRNREKAKTKLARLHARVRDVRSDLLHKVTTTLVRTYDVIGIEDLNPRGMLGNRCVALSLSDAAFGELRRQLVYKASMHGALIYVADRWYPSSKRCSACGSVDARIVFGVACWTCARCGSMHDRDENAARNLYLAASSAVKACGAEGAGQPMTVGETVRDEAGRSARAGRNGQEVAGSWAQR